MKMKSVKKVLSLALAVLMIASVMPMAMASGFSVKDYNSAMTDWMIYASNVYEDHDDVLMAVLYIYVEKTTAVTEKYPEVDFGSTEAMVANPEAGYEYTVALNEATALIEKAIAEGSIVVLIDTSKANSALYKPATDYGVDALMAVMEKAPADLTAAAEASSSACDEILAAEDPTIYTQADYDAAAADMIAYFTQIYDCLSGSHDNGSAVNNGDGTHTTVCEFCQAESTEEHTYEDGKCLCGAKEFVADDEVTEEPETETKGILSSVESLIKLIIDFVKYIIESLKK